MSIGTKIRKVRELKGYSQEYMAEKLRISQKAYSQLETNQTKLDIIRLNDIAKILDIELNNLLSFDESMVFNNNFHNKVETSQNYVLVQNSIEAIEKIYEKQVNDLHNHVQSLQGEIEFLRKQIDK